MNCKVMGIVNVTPDSFSDGGHYFSPEEAVRRARNMVEEGADIIDLGGESTRPGATPIGWEEEWQRIEPVLNKLFSGAVPKAAGGPVPISVDTYHPETAERAVAAGAKIINCVFAEPVSAMFDICAKSGAELVIPATSLGSVPKETAEVRAGAGEAWQGACRGEPQEDSKEAYRREGDWQEPWGQPCHCRLVRDAWRVGSARPRCQGDRSGAARRSGARGGKSSKERKSPCKKGLLRGLSPEIGGEICYNKHKSRKVGNENIVHGSSCGGGCISGLCDKLRL